MMMMPRGKMADKGRKARVRILIINMMSSERMVGG